MCGIVTVYGIVVLGLIVILIILHVIDSLIKLYNIFKIFNRYYRYDEYKREYKLNDEIFRDLGIDFNCGHFGNTKDNIESLKRRLDSLELDVDKPRRPIKHKK